MKAKVNEDIVITYRMWKQRDGTLIRIKDMDDTHLVKAILRCKRNAVKRAEKAAAKVGVLMNQKV